VISVPIHNQCSDFELISPVYFGRNALWIRPPGQKVDANAITGASFGEEIFTTEFTSALLYKLQRKNHPKPNNQPNVDGSFTEDSPTSLQLLVIWRYNVEHGFYVRALLIKHSNTIIWDEDTLEKLHSMHLSLCKNDVIIEDTWLLDDAVVLMTTLEWEMGYTIKAIVSEGIRKDGVMEPLWVSLNM
jgi:hypothetical protein